MTVIAFSRSDLLAIRRYGRSDAMATLQLFRAAILEGTTERYSEVERTAWWLSSAQSMAEWDARCGSRPTWVAERRGKVIGFSDLTADGEVDRLFVHPDHTRRGVGYALLGEVERCARAAEFDRLHARVSLVAEPVFARAGFIVVRRRWAERRGERLAQAAMEKVLEPVT